MTPLGELLYWLVIEKLDRSLAVLTVRSEDRHLVITQGDGERTLVSPDQDLAKVVMIEYRARILRTVPPSDGYPSLSQ